ncbi:CHAT domain-containing protein [Sandarakinorhabdus limnophila]|uniref:CHAT domain-containing protein n=1 Tax=Sandarakinorhabdus limnophila TaxID=210512 RepID=UPI0026EE5F82|nr:CHAT domain-containing protein [Sandarakinorhabdus limnophila]MCM0031870.1 CHAT domain-containing protein [Sandarakinorhabdus limnophila]
MRRTLSLMLLASATAAPPAMAADSLSLTDSFRIGTAGVLCTAQSQAADPALKGLFDRGYRIICRDAAAPVGALYALRSAAPALPAGCAVPVAATIAGLPGVQVSRCTIDGLGHVRYQVTRGRTLFVADGFAGYASALELGLQSLLADAPVVGTVEVAATEAGDPVAFARLQAGSLEPGQALAEAYTRNNSASYAESAEFFDLLVERSRQGAPGFTRSAEYLTNQGLQQSNLLQFADADRLFARAAQVLDVSDPVASRLLRNHRAQHMLNQRQNRQALDILARPVSGNVGTTDASRLASGFIDTPLSQRLNTDDAAMRALGAGSAALTPEERVAILDGQAQYLAASARAGLGELAAADTALADAQAKLARLRGGRVLSILWLRAAVANQLAIVGERLGKPTGARAALEQAVALTEAQFPQSAALLAAQAQLAALLARQGDTAASATLFRAIIKAAPETPGAGQVLRPLLGAWFAQLAEQGDTAAAADLFDASQILVRPGVAQTQAVLARELSGGSDEASALFRSSITLSRDIVRTEGDVARLAQIEAPTVIEQEQIAALRAKLAQLGRDQTAVLARLAEFPRYRSISNSTVTLASLQQALKGDEAYYKLILLGEEAYGITIAKGGAAVVKIGATAAELGQMVKAIRDSVVLFENGRPTTYPFDVPAARRLYGLLTGPGDGAAARLVLASRHLVVEPDGALLQLPFNLLVTNDDKLAEYKARQDDPNADPFDARGIAWLGRDRMISTATSARSFMDVRNIAGSRAANAYLGLGENAVPAGALPPSLPPAPPPAPPTQRGKGSKLAQTSSVRGAGADSGSGFGLAAAATPIPANSLPVRSDCDWPLVEWSRPISSAELKLAADLLKAGGSRVTTGAEFTDTALMERRDLKDYRVIHFATHGLVTAPRPECPARPALLTSFGGPLTDGLLSFRDIFDLSLDADTIILSACDTAGAATASATREAGITTGGNFALDGLVRAFVGAGARAVIASHWPVPDSFDATKTLITGLFADAGEVSVGEALRRSQVKMMDVAETSHPYYWSGFAIIGDAAKPLISSRPGVRPGP